MPLYPEINFTANLASLDRNNEKNRNNLRKIVIDFFIKERAGKGTGEETSKYKYVVEETSERERIYLTRPVPLNKGFDFIIHVEDRIFSNNKDNPKHDDIINDLRDKKTKNPEVYKKLIEAVSEVFFCKNPSDVYEDYKKHLIQFKNGLPSELILKVVKWLFIEQDIRYWNWSGRQKFMDYINDIK